MKSVKKTRTTKKAVKKAVAAKRGGARKAPATKAFPTFYEHHRQARGVRGRMAMAAGAPVDELASAAQSPDALAELRRYLKKHTPANQEYQDGFHRIRVRAAQYELMRLEYLNGHVKAGDALLAKLQDLDQE